MAGAGNLFFSSDLLSFAACNNVAQHAASSCRLHTLSDEELLDLLAQTQSTAFPSQLLLPGADHKGSKGPNETTVSPLPAEQDFLRKDMPASSSGPALGGMPEMSQHPLDNKHSVNKLLSSGTEPPASDSSAAVRSDPAPPVNQAAPDPDLSLVDDWKYRLQAFAKPLMQQMQGERQEPVMHML